jgi:hypothetical protein
LLQILNSDAIAVITGEEDQRPEVKILLELLGDDPPPQAWIKGKLQLLLQHDFAAFEDALAEYRERGFIIRRRD